MAATGGGMAATGGGTAATGGGGTAATGGGGTAATGGGTAATGGGTAASGGGTAATGGGTAASGGGTAASGGGTAATGGGTAATGGGTAASGGGTAATGGGTAATGGGTAASGGGTAASGGGTAASGGGTASPGGGSQSNPANYVFVTSQKVPGHFGGVTGGDAICQGDAIDAGLPGTYRAWLGSVDAGTAASRLGNARGWTRVDGKPFTDTLSGLLGRNQQFYPLNLDEHGAPAWSTGWTGSQTDGGVGQTCSDWTSLDAGAFGDTGSTTSASTEWIDFTQYSCLYAQPLYCFGINLQNPVSPTIPMPHRTAFITTGLYVMDSGIAQADSFCANEAVDAGLGGTYLAMLSTDAGSAWSRFDTVGGTWLRVDGAALKPTAAALFAVDGGALDTALNVTAKGVYLSSGMGDSAWSGSPTPSVPANGHNDCQNWTSSTAFAQGVGVADDTTPGIWFDFVAFGSPCHDAQHLYCMQR